jgi:hypothetical protein
MYSQITQLLTKIKETGVSFWGIMSEYAMETGEVDEKVF